MKYFLEIYKKGKSIYSLKNGISIFLEMYQKKFPLIMEYLFFLKNTKRENRFIPLKMEYLFFLKYTKGLSTVNPRYMNFYDVFFYAQNNDVKHRVYDAVPSDPLPTL